MPWWAWLLLAFVLFRMKRKHWRHYDHCSPRGRWQRVQGWGPGAIVTDGPVGCGRRSDWHREPEVKAEPSAPLSASEQRERVVSDLRRRYVNDEITVEEYESELDRILREPVNP